jgi:hypothetical protein
MPEPLQELQRTSYTEEILMNRIAARFSVSTTTAVPHFPYHHLAAITRPAPSTAMMSLVVLVLGALFVAALSAAVRSLTAVLRELLRAAAVVMSFLCSAGIAILVAVAYFAHR